jgi:hypothetical protein
MKRWIIMPPTFQALLAPVFTTEAEAKETAKHWAKEWPCFSGEDPYKVFQQALDYYIVCEITIPEKGPK